MEKTRNHLLEIYNAALEAVSGQTVVRQELLANKDHYPDSFHLVAIGKAADAMLQGVPSQQIKSGLLISKHGHISAEMQKHPKLFCLESDHPVPKQASLEAGQVLLDYLGQLPANDPCLFLISGGASALVEVLHEGWDLEQLRQISDHLLANAYSIHEINAVRRRISRIKGGGLWSVLGERSVHCLMISDVADNDPAVIGSGLLFQGDERHFPDLPAEWYEKVISPNDFDVPAHFNWKIIASLAEAKQAAATKAVELGYRVKVIDDFLSGNVEQVAKDCVAALKREPDTLHIWGGETVVTLPEKPGQGGRNQHFALASALELVGLENSCLLAAGTDGSDGMTLATGAVVDGQSVQRGIKKAMDAAEYLKNADSHTFFKETGELIVTGATGTNVMDLVIGIQKSPLK